MSINFPTAFWKNSHKVDDSTPPSSSPSITWNKQLFYSPLSTKHSLTSTEDTSLGPANVVYASNYRYDYSQDPYDFPMQPNGSNRGGGNPFADQYPPASVAILPEGGVSEAYFSWYLDGSNIGIRGSVGIGTETENRTQFAHRSNPWIIEENGRKINLFAEADGETLKFINTPLHGSSVELGGTMGTVDYSYAYYNNFVQSGSATGSFTLSSSSPKNLQILVSGLAETTEDDIDFYDYCSVRIKRTDGGDGGDLDETVCNGRNHPEIENNYPTSRNWDMNHMVFFIGDGNEQKPTQSYYNRKTSSDTISYNNNGGQDTYTNVVDQTKRRDYVRAVSQFTGEYTDLAAGDYQVVINFTSNDGQYNSGAFIGATFNFS